MTHPFLTDNIWLDKWRVDDAERVYYERKSGVCGSQDKPASAIAAEIAKARSQIRNSLKTEVAATAEVDEALMARVDGLEKEVAEMKAVIKTLVERLAPAASNPSPVEPEKPIDKPAAAKDDEDDFDLFGSDDEEDEEAERIKQERLAAYAEKKSKKPALVAKSNIILDVKPWDDETDMVAMEKAVRSVAMDGLLWGAAKLVPLAYGIKKLQIGCVVEDDKVGTDDLEERIVDFEDYVQSVDVAAFNKV